MSIALFLVIMLTVTFQIINREFIGATIVWTEELARMLGGTEITGSVIDAAREMKEMAKR